jgi:hypothetical protein
MKNRLNTMATKPTTLIHAAFLSRQPAVERVQIGCVHHPGDERHRLLRVPAPVPAPGLLGPDGAEDHPEPEDREREDGGPVGDAIQRLRVGQFRHDAGHPPFAPGAPSGDIFSRNRMLATPATRNTPEPRLTTDTWIGSQ